MANFRLRWAGLLAAAALLATSARADGDGPSSGPLPSLFMECGGPLPPRPGPTPKPWLARTQGLRFTPEGLAVLERLSATPGLASRLSVRGGRKGELVVDMRCTVSDPKSGARTWIGSLPAGDGGELVLSSIPVGEGAPTPLGSPGRVWHGALRSDTHGRFKLTKAEGFDCLVFERPIDEPRRCGNEPKRPRLGPPRERLVPEADPRTVPVPVDEPVDLLVIATPGAIAFMGSMSDVRGEVASAVGLLNQALVNSQIGRVVRLVGCESLVNPAPDPATSSASTNASEDAIRILGELTCGTAVWAVEARKLREKRGADVVCLVFQGLEGANGYANLLDQGTDASERAFCVVPMEFATSDYVLAHEVGHCLGCCHEEPDDFCESPINDHCHGCRFEDPAVLDDAGLPTRYATLMARPYDPVACRWSIPVLYFSSPTVRYAGTGPFTGTADADNAATVRSTFSRVAGFRPHVP